MASADVLHVYDRLNRLRATVDLSANDAAIWTYDAVGNILAITRLPATQTTILEVPPETVAGSCGVRILGIGFSATPGQNAVTVNGVAATVQTATPTELVVCLGGGTSTGPVVVTTPTGSDTSDGPLSVQATPAVPTITNFTPGIAVWGTALSVTGTNFDPGSGRTRLRMGATALYAPVSAVTATTLGTTVPPGTTSGRMTVTTPVGSATAPSDLFIPPTPYVATDVAVTGRLALGGSQSLTIPALKQALLVFDGTVAQKVCVGVPLTGGSLVKGAYLPTGGAMFSPYSGGATVIELGALPVAGTYQIQLRNASSTGTTSGTATLHDASDQLQGTIAPDGTATTLTFPTPCYRAGRTFTGTAGQRVSLYITSTVNSSAALTIAKPDGTPLVTNTVPNSSPLFVEPVTLPTTGTYTIWGDPNAAATGTLTLQLYDVVDVETPITPNGTPVTVALTVPGQRGALPFSGTAGQRASLLLDQLTISSGSGWIAQPDGAVLGGITHAFSAGQVRYVELPTFPTTGTYRAIVDAVAAYTGSARVSLWTYTDVTASLTLGIATPVTFTAPGQRALLTFAGTAGQRVTLQTSNPSGPLGSTLDAAVLKPDGTVLVATPVGIPGVVGTITLPVTGTYTVRLDPLSMATGTLDVTVADSPGVGLTLVWNGKIRDRVNPSEGLGTDGALDGTLTATVTAGAPTVQQLVLDATGAGSGRWDTIPSNGYWLLGAATDLDSVLLNAGNGTVNFGVADGGSFVVFATDWFNGKFVSGTTLTLKATFSGGATAIGGVTVP